MSYWKADIYIHETKAGVLEETETGYRFQYDSESFEEFGITIGLNPKQIQNIKESLLSKRDTFLKTIEKSFLWDEMKNVYKEILEIRLRVLVEKWSGLL